MRQLSKGHMKQVIAHGIIDGLDLVGGETDTHCKCETYAMAKARKLACRRTKNADAPKKNREICII